MNICMKFKILDISNLLNDNCKKKTIGLDDKFVYKCSILIKYVLI